MENPSYGGNSHGDVAIYREFENTEINGLGLPLPEGRLRFYRAEQGRPIGVYGREQDRPYGEGGDGAGFSGQCL